MQHMRASASHERLGKPGSLFWRADATCPPCDAAGRIWWTWHRTPPSSLGRTPRCSQSRQAGGHRNHQYSARLIPFKLTIQSMGGWCLPCREPGVFLPAHIWNISSVAADLRVLRLSQYGVPVPILQNARFPACSQLLRQLASLVRML